MKTIKPEDLSQLIESGKKATIVDVRNPDEFEKMHIVGAILQPLPEFKPEQTLQFLAERGLADEEIYVTCAHGGRAQTACQLFIGADYPNVTLIEGGTMAWYLAGLPVAGSAVPTEG